MFSNGVRQLSFMTFLLCVATSVHASPISYEFSGTLSQPYNGSTTFSGTFVYDTDLPLYVGIQPFPGWSYYSGVPANPSEPVLSLTFKLGNTSSSSFGNIVNDELIVSHTQGGDAFFISEGFGYANGENLHAEIGMSSNNLVARGPFSSTNPPSSLNLSQFNNGANLTLMGTLAGGQQVNIVGTINSMVQLGADGNPIPDGNPVPEPASVLIFVVMGAEICRRLRLRDRRRHRTLSAEIH